MVSPNEASFDLRETRPLSRNILHSQESCPDHTGQRMNQERRYHPTGCRDWLFLSTSQKVSIGHLTYPIDIRDTAKSGIGRIGNRHLNYLAEFVFVNVGGPYRNVKASSLPISGMSVGGSIVVGGRKSLPHGEGSQLFGILKQSNQMQTGRNLHECW